MKQYAQARPVRMLVPAMALYLVACGSSSGSPADERSSGGSGNVPVAGTGGSHTGGSHTGGSHTGGSSTLPNLSSSGAAGASGPESNCSILKLNGCIKSAVDEAVSCLDAGRVGVFSPDRKSCSFADADGIARFPDAVPSTYNGFSLSVEVLVHDELCASYTDAIVSGETAPMQLTTTSHSLRYTPGREIQVECDGVAASILNQDLGACTGTLASPQLSKNVLLGAVDIFFSHSAGSTYLLKCDDPE